MATTAQSPNDLTRQQLDELDDLLQRMLSLPLNPPDSFEPPPAHAPPTPFPVPLAREVSTPAPRTYAPPPPEPPLAWRPPPAPVPVPAPAPQPATAPRPMPAPIIERPVPAPAPARPLPAAPEAESVVAPHPEPVPLLLAPFIAFNAVLNWTLGLFGFPGRVLRSGFVKGLFGVAGMGLLVYTGLKVAQIHGLVTLPQELPWPR